MADQNSGISKIIGASAVGTLIEWYDFYIFGSLAVLIGRKLFPPDAGASALINTLAIFAAGFLVRPFGALVFGRIGDLVGRKYTFLLTLVLMGASTFLIGLIPGFETWGYAAPLAVLVLRLIQGLALGGEYGGAATYVAEHAPPDKRGFYTSWIQTTATLGLFLSLGVIIWTRWALGTEAFNDWGWRIPFLVSILLVGISIYIRMKMNESPAFAKLKEEGNISVNPIKESFSHKTNFKMVLLALFGAVMGQGVVWYTGQFYAQSFLENTCKLEFNQSRYILIVAIALATPGFIFWGWLSDRVGRKWIMMAGMLLAILTYRPIYKYFYEHSDSAVLTKQNISNSVPIATIVSINAKGDSLYQIQSVVTTDQGYTFKQSRVDTLFAPLRTVYSQGKTSISDKNLPSGAFWMYVLLVFVQILYVTMVYGPIAAFLVELFPTRIRYTSMSLPYHIGNGVFGGLVPFIATLMSSFPGSNYLSGLWYPIGVASVCLVIGSIYLNNKINPDVLH
ncbi:MAG: MHS family MFS transporter [Saprospiraceae bacterium]|jgi:MFS family permease|nr:MHS family MFS transporter [Saprospiraceae bacterium]MBK7608602.1 MHS family MFS transporter [Saprospiraceae bacterium]MBK8776404.1 MHS family MFS transporter [Saprospiraceae bacterium]MBK9678647.1 MHS family MFS transporter [Saprospiraceae bacterium]MBP8942791.1 MHS family MFS transporter [Saprospiraceae bacterium]